MKIYQGFLFIFLTITAYVGLCIANDYMFPRKEVNEIAWWGEIHFGIEGWLEDYYDRHPEYDPRYKEDSPKHDDNDHSDDSPDKD
jgi:hypothetical protein